MYNRIYNDPLWELLVWLLFTPGGWAIIGGLLWLITVGIPEWEMGRYTYLLRWTCPRKSCGHIDYMTKCPNCDAPFNSGRDRHSGIHYKHAKDIWQDGKILFTKDAKAECENCSTSLMESKPCVKCGTWIHNRANMIDLVRKRRPPDQKS